MPWLKRSAPVFVMLLLALACDDDPTGANPHDQNPPSLTISPIDTLSTASSVTIAGTARDGAQVVRVTVQRRWEPCCAGATDTLAIVPGPETEFSVTYQLTDGVSNVFEVSAYDGAGNKASAIVKVTKVTLDRSAPEIFVIAPVFAPTDSEPINVDAIDDRSALRLSYRVNGGPEHIVAMLSGTPSPYPITPTPYFFATHFRPRIGPATSIVAITVTDGGGNSSTREVRIRRAPEIVRIVAGRSHWCALASDGVVWCWGDNTYGQLGIGTTSSTLSPSSIVGGITFREIAAGTSHTCGLTDVGALYCWGAIVWDIVANRTVPSEWSTTPVRLAEGMTFSSLAPGAGHTCGLTTDSTAYCWGLNFAGQVGDSTTVRRPEPTAVAGGLKFSHLTAGAFHTCGIAAGGEAYCWGDNYSAQLGIGATIPAHQVAPVRVATSLRFSMLEGGSYQTCGIALDGAPYCWGLTDDNRLGVGIGGHGVVTQPMPVLMDERVKAISVFSDFGCALALSSAAYCWGLKNDGQLGTPFTNPLFGFEPYPILTAYGLSLAQIRTSVYGACAVSTTGALYCWGSADRDVFPGRPVVEP